MKYFTTIGDKQFEVEIKADQQIEVDNQQLTADFQSVGDQPVYSLILDGDSFEGPCGGRAPAATASEFQCPSNPQR